MTTPETAGEPTTVQVYYAAPGSWLDFTDERGLKDALDLSKPLAVVTHKDHQREVERLTARVREVEAERDAARRTADYWKGEHNAANTEIDALRAQLTAATERAETLAKWIVDTTHDSQRVMWDGYCETCCANAGTQRHPDAKPYICAVHQARAALAAAAPTEVRDA